MGMLAETFVRVRPDTSKLADDTKKEVEKPMKEAGEHAGKEFGEGMVGSLVKAFVGINILKETADVFLDFVKESVNANREAATAARQTDAVIRSTGGVASVSAKEISDYAEHLSLLSGVHKDVIQSGENVMLTFTNVRNGIGLGNDIFNQATAATLDMSRALKENLQDAVIQVGKALNDPIKGMSALRRVGVTFSDDQVKLITRLQNTGHLMDAQKIIIAELNREFGGAAAASSDYGSKVLNAWHLLTEELGGVLAPVVAKVADLFSTQMVPAIGALIEGVKTGESAGSGLAGVFSRVGAAAGQIINGFRSGRSEADGFQGSFANLGGNIRAVFDYINSTAVPVLKEAGEWIGKMGGWLFGASKSAGLVRNALGGLIGGIIAYNLYLKLAAGATRVWAVATGAYRIAAALAILVTRGWTAAQEALDGALIANPIGIIIVAIAALVAGVIYAWNHFRGFRVVVEDAWHGIVVAALWAWNNVLHPVFNSLVDIWHVVSTAALWLWHNVLDPAFHAIAATASWLWNNVIYPDFIGWRFVIMEVIVPALLWFWHNVITPAFQAIRIIIEIVWAIIRPILQLFAAAFREVIAPAIMSFWHHVVEPAFKGLSDTIKSIWNNVLHPVFTAFAKIFSEYIVPAFRTGVQDIGGAWDLIKDKAKIPINFVIGFVNAGIIHPFNDIAGFFGVKDRVQDIQKLAVGGRVHGSGGPREDRILARLSAGEFVVNAAETARWLPVLEYINSGGKRGRGPRTRYPGDGSHGIAGFAGGGLVGWLSSIGKGIWDAISDPTKFIGQLADKLLAGIPGGQTLVNIIGGMGHKLIDALVAWVKGQGGGGNAGGALAFLRAQVGKPYVWDSAGPGGYDCSGIISAVWNVLHGRNPYSHTFSTSNEAGFFPLPGMGGILSAGWTNPGEPGPGGTSVGHTAGVLGGLAFESAGGIGVHIGAGVTDIQSFAHIGHFDRGGLLEKGWNAMYNGTGGRERLVPADRAPHIAFSPTYHIEHPVDERELARHTVGRLAFAVATGAIRHG